jgi:hypothetical protein
VTPTLAKDDQILDLPALVRKLREPAKKIIGDLAVGAEPLGDRGWMSTKGPGSHIRE